MAPEDPEGFKNFLFLLEEEDLEGEDLVEEDLEGEDFVDEDFVGEDLVDEDLEGEDLVDEDLEGDNNLSLLFEEEKDDFLLDFIGEFLFATKLLFSLNSSSEI